MDTNEFIYNEKTHYINIGVYNSAARIKQFAKTYKWCCKLPLFRTVTYYTAKKQKIPSFNLCAVFLIKLRAVPKEIMTQCLAYLKKQVGVYPRAHKKLVKVLA